MSRAQTGKFSPVPTYGTCRSAEIAATPQECFDALTDYGNLPSWQGAVKRAEVLERDEQGRGTVLEYEIDAKVKTVRYRLRQAYEEPHRITSEYLGGDFRDFKGEWRFIELPDGGTRAEVDVDLDPGRFVPGPIRKAISDAVMRRAVTDLKNYLEGTSD